MARRSALKSALCAAAIIGVLHRVAAFTGVASFYGGAGIGGACTSAFNYPGFRTVSMNAPQYANGAACGACVHGCFTQNGKRTCFNAIVDNMCPECKQGGLDLGWKGDGLWTVTWNYIKCPAAKMQVRTVGSNPWYGKMKIEGVGRVLAVTCRGKPWKLSTDGFWIGTGSGFNCGMTCTMKLDYNRVVSHFVPGSLFGGKCTG